MTKFILFACPGCSMPRPFVALVNPSHYWIAWLIVILAVTIVPLLISSKILLVGKLSKKPSFYKKLSFTIILTIVFLMEFGPTYNFGGVICFWLFLPLNIVCAILMGMLWDFAILVILSFLIVIPLYMYFFLKIIFKFDRKYCWRWSKTGKRLLQQQKFRLNH